MPQKRAIHGISEDNFHHESQSIDRSSYPQKLIILIMSIYGIENIIHRLLEMKYLHYTSYLILIYNKWNIFQMADFQS